MHSSFVFLDDPDLNKKQYEVIPLNARLDADLEWSDARKMALEYRERKKQIFWEIDLGLFSHLSRFDQSTLLSLGLALQHFRETLWTQFQEQTCGFSIYRGSIAYQLNWTESLIEELRGWLSDLFQDTTNFIDEVGIEISDWNTLTPENLASSMEGSRLLHLFKRDVATEYMELLVQQLPAGYRPTLLFETSEISDPLLLAQLLAKDRFQHLSRAMTAGVLSSDCFLEDCEAAIGICLPPMTCNRPSQLRGLRQVLNDLLQKKIPFRVISEAYLTSEWQGLDTLFVVSNGVTKLGERKLRGFEAAGGTVKVIK